MNKYSLVFYLSLILFKCFAQEDTIDIYNYNRAVNYYNMAIKDYARLNYLTALENFKRAIQLNPYNPDYPFGLACSYYELNKYDSAKKYIEKAISLKPNQSNYHHYAGNIYFHLQAYDEAYKNYTIALNTKPDSVALTSYINRGISGLYTNNYESAVEDFTVAMAEDSTNEYSVHLRGVALLKLKRRAEACQDFLKANDMGYATSIEYIKKYCK